MSAGVIDQFELIEIDEEQRVTIFFACRGECVSQANLKFCAIDQSRECIVARAKIYLLGEPSVLRHIVKDQNDPEGIALVVQDRGYGILNAVFRPVSG